MEKLLGLQTESKIKWSQRRISVKRNKFRFTSTDTPKLDAIYNEAMTNAVFDHLEHLSTKH